MQDNDHVENGQGSLDEDDQLSWVERPLAEVLGIEVRFASDELAPPVDLNQIQRFLRHEMSRDEIDEVCDLIGNFRPWYEAYADALHSGIRHQ